MWYNDFHWRLCVMKVTLQSSIETRNYFGKATLARRLRNSWRTWTRRATGCSIDTRRRKCSRFQEEALRFHKHPLWKLVMNNRTEINPQGWVDRKVLEFEKGKKKQLVSREYFHLKTETWKLYKLLLVWASKMASFWGGRGMRNELKERDGKYLEEERIVSWRTGRRCYSPVSSD